MTEDLRRAFHERFTRGQCRVARAPGRVNLIGEHTDYNDGFVFPAAIDRYVTVAFAASDEPTLRGYSLDFGEERASTFDGLCPCTGEPTWFDYVGGVAWALRREGAPLRGIDFVVSGDVPMGAGLSSSAALELAVTRALVHASGAPWDGRAAALAGQRAENDFIGLKSGVMDQMASALSREGTAMLLDCRDLSIEHVALPRALAVVVMDTGTRRSVAASAYNERRSACKRAVAVVSEQRPGVTALRDATEEDLESARATLGDVVYRRALHVVRENERTRAMRRALERSDASDIAALMEGSHASLRDLYEVSSPELDRMVSLAVRHPACVGARMTGAGFGGCAVSLVSRERVDAFVQEVGESYGEGRLFRCRPVSGAELL